MKRNKRKVLLRLSPFLAVAAAFIFIFSLMPYAKAQTQTLKIGGIYALTGSMALYGINNKNGAELAVEEINAAGGIKSLGGAKLELVAADGQAKPDVSMSAMERLITSDNVLAVLTQPPATTEVAAATVSERLKTPHIIPIAVSPKIIGEGKEYIFKLAPNADKNAMDQIDFVQYFSKVTGKKIEKVGIIGEDTDYGQDQRKAWRELFKLTGVKVVADMGYPFTAQDLTPVVLKLKAADPDIVLQASFLPDSVLLRKTSDKLAFVKPWLDTGLKSDPSYKRIVGERLAEHEMGINQWNFDMKNVPGAKELDERFQKKHGTRLSGVASAQYQSILILADALERAGKATREDLREALKKTDIRPGNKYMISPMECIKFQDKTDPGDIANRKLIKQKGLNECASLIITQMQKGDWRAVWPEKYASSKPVFPE